MQHTPNTDSYLAIARADAADRQRRADRYRQTREAATGPRVDRRRATVTALVTVVLSAVIVAFGPTATADDVIELAPGQPPLVTHEVEVRTPDDRLPGRPDGWYAPDHEPSTGRVPPGVR